MSPAWPGLRCSPPSGWMWGRGYQQPSGGQPSPPSLPASPWRRHRAPPCVGPGPAQISRTGPQNAPGPAARRTTAFTNTTPLSTSASPPGATWHQVGLSVSALLRRHGASYYGSFCVCVAVCTVVGCDDVGVYIFSGGVLVCLEICQPIICFTNYNVSLLL